jgi:hypothetical protein
MKEFGSDFHLIPECHYTQLRLTNTYRDVVMMADGRHCIIALIRQERWRRLWMPEYFCYDVIKTIKQLTGIEIALYPDYPLAKDKDIIKNLPYADGDVLFRINYFGMRNHRSEKDIPVPVIEDHTHDLMGHWALYSDADWCIASLRKSLPLPEGGILWSPKKKNVTIKLTNTEDNQRIANMRWQAMQMKYDYLNGTLSDKETFRKLYVETEEWFDTAELSLIDERSKDYLSRFDIDQWQKSKKNNWRLLYSLLSNKIQSLQPEDDLCTMFSLVLLAESQEQRDMIRHRLIERSVYPAILWQVPEKTNEDVQDFSHRMLSIHCDGRYSEEDIRLLAEIVNQAIES